MSAGFAIPFFAIAVVIGLPLVLLFIFAMAVLNSSNRKSMNHAASRAEEDTLRTLLKQLDTMEQRIGNLETILSDRRKN